MFVHSFWFWISARCCGPHTRDLTLPPKSRWCARSNCRPESNWSVFVTGSAFLRDRSFTFLTTWYDWSLSGWQHLHRDDVPVCRNECRNRTQFNTDLFFVPRTGKLTPHLLLWFCFVVEFYFSSRLSDLQLVSVYTMTRRLLNYPSHFPRLFSDEQLSFLAPS